MDIYNNTSGNKGSELYNGTGYPIKNIRPYPKKLQEILESLRTECALQHASSPAIKTGKA